MKLHIQLEEYNGKKYDFIEVEVHSVDEINSAYEMLEEMRSHVHQPKTIKTTTSTPSMAYYKQSGRKVTDKNNVHMTQSQYGKAVRIFQETGTKIWELEIGKDL